jgi:hypothetical protein
VYDLTNVAMSAMPAGAGLLLTFSVIIGPFRYMERSITTLGTWIQNIERWNS